MNKDSCDIIQSQTIFILIITVKLLKVRVRFFRPYDEVFASSESAPSLFQFFSLFLTSDNKYKVLVANAVEGIYIVTFCIIVSLSLT